MNRMKRRLIQRARETYKTIYPCGGRPSFSECFTHYEDKVLFWFDTEDRSTHVVTDEMPA
ncbi:MAG: hypothetical protein GF344_03135 [Chitinivibrionales bacterium]|nr:hypothetical protein [Chitinivibrionales bacterium]MBD3356073.1 hypothetical protein [Chitinivibrionales bacterium]